jgi:hypothetical protein
VASIIDDSRGVIYYYVYMVTDVFTTLYFLFNLRLGPKLGRYITLDWKRLLGTNTLAYCAQSSMTNTENYISLTPNVVLTILYFLFNQLTNGPNWLECYTRH